MIFNPLFLSENNGSQIMAPRQTKMSNSKYLFSDIVKVVMNPVGESTEMTNANNGIIGNNIDLSLDNTQKPVQLKLKFLSDIDNEKAKLGLAEILPIEIAQLLIKDETKNSEEKAVSYISKEPLKGELQNFVNNLIGPELIASHLNNKSGLLLSLEDSKSAVNLELAQVTGKQSANDNIVVQTLVVPEKSKLLSLMGDVQSKNGLFRIDNSQIQNLTNIGQPLQNSLDGNRATKPTLSVYSFNYGGDKFESLTKTIKLNTDIKPGLSVVSKPHSSEGLSNGVNKVPLEKLSFTQNELKNTQPTTATANLKSNSASATLKDGLKLVKTETENTSKDFSVSKITIVKKTSDTTSPEKISTSNKSLGSILEAELTRIDFRNQNTLNAKPEISGNEINISKKVNNHNNSILKNIISNLPKGENVNQNSLINEGMKTERPKSASSINNPDNLISKSVDRIKNIISNSNMITEKNENSSEKVKVVNTKDISEKETNSNPKKIVNSEDKTNLVDNKSHLANGKTESSNSNLNLKNIETVSKTADGKITNENITGKNELKLESAGLQRSENNNAESDKSGVNKVNITDAKETKSDSKIDQKTSEVSKSSNSEQNKNNTLLGDEDIRKGKETGVKENSEKSTLLDGKIVIAQNVESKKNDNPLANKKISIKVKGDVKSVSEKLDTQVKNNQESSQKENSSANNSTKDNSSKGEFDNTPFLSSRFSLNVSAENSFQTIMSENGIGVGNAVQGRSGIESEVKHKTIKSVEVLKEVVKFISKQEKGSLSFDIKPEQLGKMKITLDSADHVLRAKIEVDTEQARQLIERNLDKLHQELADNGIELNSLNISLSNPKQQKEDGETMSNKNNSQTQNLGQVGETQGEEKKKTLGYNTYEYIA